MNPATFFFSFAAMALTASGAPIITQRQIEWDQGDQGTRNLLHLEIGDHSLLNGMLDPLLGDGVGPVLDLGIDMS